MLPRNQSASNVLTEPALFIHVRLVAIAAPAHSLFIDSQPNMEKRSSTSSSMCTILSLQHTPCSRAMIAPTGNVGLRAMAIKMECGPLGPPQGPPGPAESAPGAPDSTRPAVPEIPAQQPEQRGSSPSLRNPEHVATTEPTRSSAIRPTDRGAWQQKKT
ncbi:unnamed protein product [Pleuronectes platessa]|uniref:Uncharacterized protein n=1 Tax=Pleuronectes platessa TaxID=8262 RepID=A0A9N7Z334_PLEPL|nr:unnamed protein product [Pleuronectes platessa]